MQSGLGILQLICEFVARMRRTCIARFMAISEIPSALADRLAHAGIANRHFLRGIVLVAAAHALFGPIAVGAIDPRPAELFFVGTVATGMALQQSPVSPDTLDVLLGRVLVLEAIADSSFAEIDGLREELEKQRMETARERNLRIDELEGLHISFAALLDSASSSTAIAVLAKLEADLGSLRSEVTAARSELGNEVSGIARDLGGLDSTIESWKAAFVDSMAMVDTRIVVEQLHRMSGDRHNAVTAGIAAGLLLIGIGFMWWYVRRRATALDGRMRQIQPGIAGQLEKVRDEIAHGVHQQSIELLGNLLGSIEQMAEVLGAIQTLAVTDSTATAEPDHELPISICNVVNRIERTLSAMGSSVKGHKHLLRCVRDVKASLRLHNYEILDLVGVQYDTQMENLNPEFSFDDSLAPGEQIITRINRPLVLHGGRPVQGASVTVSVGS